MRRWPLAILIAATLGLVGCSDDSELCSDTGEARGAVVTFATFAKRDADEEGVAEGIDIDGRESDSDDAAGCYTNDFVSPDGRRGIDNQFATLLPLIEEFVGTENIDAILEGGIANGQILMVMNVEGVDDTVNDDCVRVTFGAGSGTPFLDAEGEYVSYQTFGFDEERAGASELPGRIENGVLFAGPADVIIPVRILDADFELHLRGARFRMAIEDDPLGGGWTLSGFGGGGLEVDDLKDIVTGLTVGDDLVAAVVAFVQNITDMAANETKTCSQISAALRFRMTPAFVDRSLAPPVLVDAPAE